MRTVYQRTLFVAAALAVGLVAHAQPRANGNGTVQLHAVDQAHLAWQSPGPDSGREAQIPVSFPDGDWTKVEITLTVDSGATPNLCSYPNPTGDIYDRSASVFLILDESCIDGTRCIGTDGQLELMKAITPFGTDTRTGPRALTLDITPLAPLLTGTKYIGVWIDTYDLNGWYANVDFTFTADPLQASPKPPASGIIPVFFKTYVNSDGQPSIDPVSVAIPPTATQVMLRLFSTGHGGVGSPPCDEFCHRNNQILIDGGPAWEHDVWRTDCNAAPGCRTWNACGYPSCTFSRAGWCPGYIACYGSEPCDQDLDLTSSLTAGDSHDVLYQIQNITPGGAYWNYSLVIYWYE